MKYISLLLLFASCTPQLATQSNSTQTALDEVRVALLDVRQAYSTQKIDLQNLEEKVAELKPNALIKTSSIEARISQLEKQLAAISTDLHNLNSQLNQNRTQIAALDAQLKSHTARFDEISTLKTTLNSISQAISKEPQAATQIHRVVSGESLEKIARHYSVTVESLKKANGLTTSTIMIGQELKIPE